MSLKNPVTPPGIDPGTVRLVAQRLNHYATPGPTTYIYIHILLSVLPKSVRVVESVKRPAKGLMTVVRCQARGDASVIIRRSARTPIQPCNGQ